MDPLSIVASSIAIAGTASIALKAVHQTLKAKPDLLALLNEVTDVAAILREVDHTFRLDEQTNSNALRLNNDLLITLSETKAKLELLAESASKWTSRSARSRSVDGPNLWWLRIALRVQAFREDFRALKSKLNFILPALTIQGASRIELDLRQVMLFARDTAANQSALHGQLQSELVEHRNYLQSISQNFPMQSNNESATTLSGFVESGIEGTQDTTVQPESEVMSGNNEGTIRAFHHNGSILFDSSQMTAVSAVGIRTAQFPRSACQPWCSCACHSERRLRSPQLLDQVIGSLFIGYSGLPGLTRPCNQNSCHLRSQPMTYMTYFFPQWFLARTISFVLSTTPLAGPVASLKVSRTVPGDSAIFTYAKTGDVQRIKSLFEGGQASPHDVHFESGITALHLAISHRQYSVCKFLLQANADPFMEDRTSWTAADNAWTKILSNSLDSESENALRSMFSVTECLERRDFTVLHKIVLGFVNLNLERELTASSAEINTLDSNERTPLSIAAERGDSRTVSILLEFGANPNIASNCQASPLHYAASATDPSCIPLLLAHRASVDSMTNWDQTPLHYVAAYTKDARHAELLLAAGSNPHIVDLDGIDPLGWAAITGNTSVADVLLNKGVDIFHQDKRGDSALVQSVRGHHHEMIALLMGHGAHAELRSPDSKNVWHITASVADITSMHLLKRVSFEGTSVDLDISVLQELVRDREDTSHELVSTFDELASTYNQDLRRIEISDEDIWEDAMESLQVAT